MNLGKYIANVVIAFIAYGILYTVGVEILFAEEYAAMGTAMRPEEDIMVGTLAYHFAQTVVVVWLFAKAVNSNSIKDGAIFGFMIGLYLLASDNIWFTSLKDFPSDARIPMDIMHLVVGVMVGSLLAFLHGKGLSMTKAVTE
ncbi:hypothetical protein [Kordiimonas sp. SCSIO 12610]|uniref:hypothetical protein n=1 Tax=Kordiimonas sp. SCSIO 12610 TaxID=2829597 RepID=UPI0021096F46|nr:hypothetical protein [Kordiimonas sp. SCSIO 12610]UTW54845.1 hypothetical protein KFF44_13690 [Kordiimonas sp. SCSIO 12610]